MIPAILAILAIILESWSSIWHSVDLFLQSQQLTVGAILTGMVPFFVIWNKISKEKEKKARAQRVEIRQLAIENRQQRIESKIDDLMHHSGVESTWNLQEIESTHMVHPNLKKFVLLSQAVTILRRKKLMDKLKSRKLWMAIFGALLPIINEEFNLGLNADTVIASVVAIVGYVLGQAHVDAKKVESGVVDAKPTIDGSSDK